jgi:hypothetical protein
MFLYASGKAGLPAILIDLLQRGALTNSICAAPFSHIISFHLKKLNISTYLFLYFFGSKYLAYIQFYNVPQHPSKDI